MRIFAIDPGPTRSAWCLYDRSSLNFPIRAEIVENLVLVDQLARFGIEPYHFVVEMIASYGMPVGAEVFETCRWIGRFEQVIKSRSSRNAFDRFETLTRGEVKLHLCGSLRARDSNVRQVLADRFGKKGTKKAPGKLYGFRADMWAALAVAVTAGDQA